MKKFAVFDIDGTLIRWQMFHAIVHHLGKHGYIPSGTHKSIGKARMAWKERGTESGFNDYERVLVSAYRAALRDINPLDYEKIVSEVFKEYKNQTFVYTRDLVRSLKQQNYLIFAISGSQTEIVEKLGAHHGFDEAVGAQLVVKNGVYTGEINSPVHDKAAVLERLIAKYKVTRQGSIAVGDSLSDVSMLEMVEKPIAFNPDKLLFEQARQKGWKVVIERKNVVYELERQDGKYLLV